MPSSNPSRSRAATQNVDYSQKTKVFTTDNPLKEPKKTKKRKMAAAKKPPPKKRKPIQPDVEEETVTESEEEEEEVGEDEPGEVFSLCNLFPEERTKVLLHSKKILAKFYSN